MSTPSWIAIGTAIFLGVGGGLLTPIGPWYRGLRKPSFQPPDWAFGPAWTIILGLWAWSAILGWSAAPDAAARSDVAIVFGVNAVCHFLWSPLFFKARRPDWALVEVVFLWVSIVAIIAVLWPIDRTAALMNLPYLAWVSFAAVLNRAIVRLNAPFA